MKIHRKPNEFFKAIGKLKGDITIICSLGIKDFILDSNPKFLTRAKILEYNIPLRCDGRGQLLDVYAPGRAKSPSQSWLEGECEIVLISSSSCGGGAYLLDRLHFGEAA